MRCRLVALCFLLIAGCLVFPARAEGPPDRPNALAERAIVISVDGLRPDLLIRAKTPNIRALMEQGSFSMWARTTDIAVTLPSHASMMTGVAPETHGINFNNDGPDEPVYPKVPTVFELAKGVGYTTAIASGKSKFAILAKPGTIDYSRIPKKQTGFEDPVVAENAVELIRDEKPQLMLVHFAGNDKAGHKFGWGTPEQLAAIEGIDKCIGRVLDALRESELLDETLIILSADHGGQGKSHGKDDMRSRHIPWIARGPGIRRNLDLTRFKELNIRTEDTFATICRFLDIPVAGEVDGKPVELILEDLELMTDAPPRPAPTPPPTSTAPVSAAR